MSITDNWCYLVTGKGWCRCPNLIRPVLQTDESIHENQPLVFHFASFAEDFMSTRSLSLVLVVFFCFTACSAANNKVTGDVLGQLELSEARYSESQSAEQASVDASKLAQQKADLARQDRLRAAQLYAADLSQAGRLMRVEAQKVLDKAKGYEDKMCKVDPGRCDSGAPVSSTPVPPPVSVPVAHSAYFLDIRLDDFTTAGLKKLTQFPERWHLAYTPESISLEVSGVAKSVLQKSAYKPRNCYRFTEQSVYEVPCPTGS